MSDLPNLLHKLRAEGVNLWVHEGQLRMHAPGTVLEETVEELRRRKPDVIALLQQPPLSRTSELVDQARPQVLALSYAQEGLWFLEQLGVPGHVYTFTTIQRIEGGLDVGALGRAFDEIARRHEILRTRYEAVEGVPHQVIDPPAGECLRLTDWCSSEVGEREERALRELRAQADRPFDLHREAPFRVYLARLSPEHHLLMVHMHHIMIDGPSLAMLFKELQILYGAYRAGDSSPLPEPRAQFADFARWQRQWLQGELLQSQIAYWRSRLEKAPDSLDLPVDFLRPAVPDFSGSVVEFSFPRELEEALRALARRLDSTLFTILLAAFHVLLSRWSGVKDVCVGVPVDSRNHRDAEDMVGFFLNTVVVRADLSGNPPFESVARQVRGHLIDAWEHRDVPFDRVVADLRPERRLARQPLFQVLFSYLTEEAPVLPGLIVAEIEPEERASKFELSLFLSEAPTGLRGGVEYATSLFERTTVERFVRRFTTLLEGIAAAPRTPIGDLPVLDRAEMHQVLSAWNDTGVDFDTLCVHELFERQAALTPNAIAAVFGKESLSYAALDARANRIAHRLRSLGAGPEALVGICVERSLEMIAGLLGILKAGAAYLPLDPSYPPARLAMMLEDSHASILVTEEKFAGLLPAANRRTLCLDRDRSIIDSSPSSSPTVRVDPRSVAYVIYTSGSTGRPKGIAVQHRSVASTVCWAQRTFDSGLRSVLFSTSICFDLSVFELYSTLASGGTLVLVRDALALADGAPEVELALINTVPSAAQALVDAGAIPRSVRWINLAGEPLRRQLVEQIRAAVPGIRVHNLYGPSENTVYSTGCEVDGQSSVTIGRAIANTQTYILDERLTPVPIGSSGEIYLAGAGLARGYWERSALTAERFVPNPFGSPGSRMYRTGDLGRYRIDGAIEFLGRIDHQVKVRGYRIELGEIESALLQCEEVAASLVAAVPDAVGGQRLVAYVVGGNRSERELHRQLRRTLPEFMLPAVYVFLDAFPLLPNGKVDRKSLPVPGAASLRSEDEYVAPRTPTEGLLAEIWSEVLNVPRIGIHDNFFELGGHSLLATQVVSRARRSLHADITLSALFIAPTVAELARVAGTARAVREEPIQRAAPMLPRVSSFAQRRMWFLDQLEPGSDLYVVAAAWRLGGVLDVSALEHALDEIVRRHEVLRTVFANEDGDPVPVVLDHTPVAMALCDVSGAADPEAEATAQMADIVRRPFDLAHGPMLRLTLLRLGAREHILMVAFHHVVADGWSLDVMLAEISALYAAFANGNPSPLRELAIQYTDYARWQADFLRGEVLQEHLTFWRRYLEGVPGTLELPTDHPRPKLPTYRGGIVTFELGETLSERLRDLSRRRQATLFMAMAAAFNVMLHRYSGQDDLCVGYAVGNRDRPEIEELIGIFANTLVLRTRLAAGDTFDDQLARVRDSMLDADVHKDLPFEKLVEELRPPRDLSRHPIFQVTYSYSTTHGSRSRRGTTLPSLGQRQVAMPGLSINLFEPENQTAKFDLALFISDVGPGHELEGDFEYSSDLFERGTIKLLAQRFRALLEWLVSNPSAPVADAPLVDEAERRRLEGRIAPQRALPSYCSLHAMFEEQAARTPAAVAVSCDGEEIRYGELDERANRLAHQLRSLGVGPEALVPICMERSIAMVVAILGVLKAGGAYVPMDPVYPRARLERMLVDCGARLLVAPAQIAATLGLANLGLTCVDPDAPLAARPCACNPVDVVQPSNLAYCLYTSGSTGQPKGVAMTHGNAIAFILWAQGEFTAEERARVLFSTSICFDLSIFELFVPLSFGGAVLLVRDALELIGRTASSPPTMLNTVPSAAKALLEAAALPRELRAINLAGEALRPDLAAGLLDAVPGARLRNLYGPTEFTTYATCCSIGRGERVTIGRPLPGMHAYILDGALQPLPTGVSGEIYLSGAGLARGYWGGPELTAERFVPDPFGAPGERMYRTGDRGRYHHDGSLDFLGRDDRQVKIRGFRIEIDEVETALRQCAGVRDAAVVSHETAPGELKLVAYVARDGTGSTQDVIAQIRMLLPEHMVPSAFIDIDAMPLTPNGKLDRRALPAPDPAARIETVPYGAPRTPVESALADIWADVLEVDRVGIHDNFFEMGGHSLLASRLVTRMRSRLLADVHVRELFVAPTIAALSNVVQAAGKTRDEPILRLPAAAPRVASFAQEQIWFLDRLHAGTALYNMPAAWTIEGDLHVSALEKALNAIVARHEALRTTFRTVGGAPVPVIAEESVIGLPVVQVSPGCDSHARLQELIQREGARSFDLERGPLVRAMLARIGEREHVLLLTLHHLVSDGGSMDVILDELRTLYDAFVSNSKPALPLPAIQYTDFAGWQRQQLEGEKLQEHIAYWTRYLQGSRETIELPTDRPRGPTAAHRGRWVAFDVSAPLSSALRELGRQAQATPFMTLAAAFGVLLHRYSWQDDLCIGYPVGNRDRPELEGVVGPFMNMLVLRMRFDRTTTFRTLLAQVRESVLDAIAVRELPFQKLVEAMNPQRAASHQPLFQVVLSMVGERDVELPGLNATRVQPFDRTSKFDMTLFLADTADGFAGGIEYATDLFEPATMGRLIGHLSNIMDAIVRKPDAPIAALEMLGKGERRQILTDWNRSSTPSTPAVGAHLRFEQHAERRPDWPAICHAGNSVTYGELDARANRLAHYLRQQGIREEMVVALCLEPSVEMVAASLAVLKAGAAYVPLDPTMPHARLSRMLDESGAAVLITNACIGDRLTAHRCRVLCPEGVDAHGIERQATCNPRVHTYAQSLAYCIFTSGSTGRPKLVEVTHGGLLNLVDWHRQFYEITPADRIAQFARVAFDASVWEIWSALAGGATLCVPDEETRHSPAKIPEWLSRHAVTHCFLPTPLAEAVLAEQWCPTPHLKALLTGGDTLHRTARSHDSFVFVNHYGPTECSVVSACGIVDANEEAERLPSIGRPIYNTQVYIVGPQDEPVPVGVVGELLIGGSGVGRGYRGSAALTAERFTPDPFGLVPGARIYRTGDLARYLPDGRIHHVGRVDDQIKVRGYRVEYGEIEVALASHASVMECAVTRMTDPRGEQQLVAYVVPRPDAAGESREYRRHLQDLLPEPLVPATYVILESLPRLSSGKVDRSALPQPEILGMRAERYVPPRTPVEIAIADIWRDLLSAQRVGIHDNFFACGGQSLLAAQAISRIRDAVGVELTLSAFFDAPTVAELSEVVESLCCAV